MIDCDWLVYLITGNVFTGMKMTARTHQGLVRIKNEDCVFYDESGGYAIVADGMGGLMAGEVASKVAVAAVREHVEQTPGGAPVDVRAAALAAHEAVLTRAHRMNFVGKMGTTLVLWVLGREEQRYCHVGDSRLYVYADGVCSQVSHDHTLAQRMIDDGTVPADQAHTAPNRHVLTRAVGLPGECDPECGVVPPKGRLLLCSDGLSDLVTDDQIAKLLATDDIERCADNLVKAALDKGGRDNISVVLVDR